MYAIRSYYEKFVSTLIDLEKAMADEQQKQTEAPVQENVQQAAAEAEPAAEQNVETAAAEETVADAAALGAQLAQAQDEIAALKKELAEIQPRTQAEIQNIV